MEARCIKGVLQLAFMFWSAQTCWLIPWLERRIGLRENHEFIL